MPPRRSARAKAEESTAAVPAEAKPEPKTPVKKGKAAKRALSDDEGDEPAAKKAKPDGTPRRPNGTAFIVPVDFQSGRINTDQVYVDGKGEVYDAMLNQTNIGGNNNKFYILQLLHPKGNNNEVSLYTRWGRVGEGGSTQTKGPFPAAKAVTEFCKQFKAKTATDFSKRVGMVQKTGKYIWLEKEYDDEGGSSASPSKKPGKAKEEDEQEEDSIIPDSKLPNEVQGLVEFIFNPNLMQAHLQSMNYDINKQPLGKLGQSTIAAGYSALKELAEVIESPNGAKSKSLGGFKSACETLSGRYYTVIPHAFGRMRPVPIATPDMLKRELDLVESLGEMETAQKINVASVPKDDSGNPINPLDSKLASLDLQSIEVVDPKSSEFKRLVKYAKDTNAGMDGYSTNTNMSILNMYRIERKGEEKRWLDGKWDRAGDGERLLLWHGSRTTNFVGILKTGLRIAPPEAPVTGYEFGKGVYFGDMFGISANYTHHHLSDNTGLLLLCEVVARPFHEAYEFDFSADVTSKKEEKVATKALGKLQHEEWEDAGGVLGRGDLRGVMMPASKAKDLSHTFPRPSVKVEDIWNEYIVYDVSQIRIRYLLQVKL